MKRRRGILERRGGKEEKIGLKKGRKIGKQKKDDG